MVQLQPGWAVSYLHSNMVLLILAGRGNPTGTRKKFTFQYGSINTREIHVWAKNCKTFTFQYGSINTFAKIALQKFLKLFTFQYGSINTEHLMSCVIDGLTHLHSNMVLLIRHNRFPSWLHLSNLHSNMVLLIQQCRFSMSFLMQYLHSNMVLLILVLLYLMWL